MGGGEITQKSGRCGTHPYNESPDGADLNQVPPCYKYNGKQADTGNNKRQQMLRSTSVVLFLHAWHFSSEFIHEGAQFSTHQRKAEAAQAAGHANQTSGPIFMFSLLRKNKLHPMKIKLRDETLHSPLWSSSCSILQETQCLTTSVIEC